MPTPVQKAEYRPISFVLHDLAAGSSPIEVGLRIRPEDLSRQSISRLTVHQTLGGAWADNFGEGVPVVNISGHTGWGQGNLSDGLEDFKNLHETIFQQWHKRRDAALKAGRDPDLVKLIFSDTLDDFTWVVSPQTFVLRRSKSRPLLSQYQISMMRISADVKMPSKNPLSDATDALQKQLGLDSLTSSIEAIEDFSKSLQGDIASALGVLQAPVKKFVDLTNNVSKTVHRVLTAGAGIVDVAAGGLLEIGRDLNKAASNIAWTVQSIIEVPQHVKAKFMKAASAFNNAACVFSNIFSRRTAVRDYSSLYGSSTCSSTAGGRAPSPFAGRLNPFDAMFPAAGSRVSLSGAAAQDMSRLASIDLVNGGMTSEDLRNCAVSVVGGLNVGEF